MADAASRYPLLRGRRGRRRRRRIPLRTVAVVLLSLAVLLGLAFAARQAMKPDPRRELATALGLLAAGNYSAARDHARIATRTDPAWGLAHAVLARTLLATGDGVSAEAALGRATANGFASQRGHQLLAHARLLQGDPAAALIEAKRSTPRFAAYADRVRALALAAQGDRAAAQDILTARLAANPRDSLAWSDLGRIRLDGGDIVGASDAAARAVAFDRANLAALMLRGELVRTRYGPLAALPWFDAALARDPRYFPALVERAATRFAVGHYAAALADARTTLAVHPGASQPLYLEAALAARAGQFDLARDLFAKLRGRADALPGGALLSGALDYAQGKDEQAVGRWRDLVARQPRNAPARRLFAVSLLRSGDAAGARDVLRPLAFRDDADPYTLFLTARACEILGERDWAARFLDRAQLAAPATAPAPYDRGDVAGGPTPLAAGDALALLGRWGEAARAYATAADLRFDEPAMLRLVDAHGRAGNSTAAANALALFLGQNPRSIAARRIAANLQVAARDWDGARVNLLALRRDVGARDAALAADLARAYTGLGDPATGLRYAREAYALMPMNAAVADAYGWALYQHGDDAAARQLFDKATRLAPADPAIRWHYAQALADLGRTAEARLALAAALADPRFLDRAPAQALLATLR